MKRVLIAAAAAFVAACAPMKTIEPAGYEDGELPLPAGYRSWPKFLSAVQRPDAKQVREIYVNAEGFAARSGEAFARGTVFVMENWTARTQADGTVLRDADGRLVKDQLARVFVMGKGAGFGAKVPPPLKNGEWVYAAFDGAGKKTGDDLNTCRACHLPQAAKDFVFRYDEHFGARSRY
jgi:hemoglobin